MLASVFPVVSVVHRLSITALKRIKNIENIIVLREISKRLVDPFPYLAQLYTSIPGQDVRKRTEANGIDRCRHMMARTPERAAEGIDTAA